VETALIGIDASASRVWMQVRHGRPQMKCQDGLLRPVEHPGDGTKVLLGDAASVLLRISGPHDSIRFLEEPRFDEQRWKLEIVEPTVRMTVTSRPYWGFGMFARCYLNELLLEGSLERRARLIFDLVASMGRNPWEASFGLAWKRITGAGPEVHRRTWESLITHATESMGEEIAQYEQRLAKVSSRATDRQLRREGWDASAADESLASAAKDISIARQALHESNAAGLRRALDRVEVNLIAADPLVDIDHSVLSGDELSDVLSIDDIPFVDLTEEE